MEGDGLNFEPDYTFRFWRLAHSVTITQAAFLIMDEDPGAHTLDADFAPEKSDIWRRDQTATHVISPERFRSAYNAVYSAAQAELFLVDHFREESGVVIWAQSRIAVSDLKRWLSDNDVRPVSLFGNRQGTEATDPSHPRYAPKLAAALSAWEAVKEAPPNKTVKQGLVRWLNENAARFGLVDDEGLPREKLIAELAAFANWDPNGGPPKTVAVSPKGRDWANEKQDRARSGALNFDDDTPT